MNDIQVFTNNEFGEIRTVEIEGEPWLVGRDVATILGYAKPQNAISMHVDKDDALKQGIPTNGGIQHMTLINESGFYSLVLGSKLLMQRNLKDG